jgi:hypothetical protein
MIVIADIDHTVSNAFWRDSQIGSVPWDEYYANLAYDKPFRYVINLLNSLSWAGYTIIGITGVPEKFRQLRLDWLIKYHVDIDELLMRPNDVFLKNSEMKVKLVTERFNNDFKKIHFILDDNEETVIDFFNLGIPTLQVRNINGREKREGNSF